MSSTNKTVNYSLSQWLPGDTLTHGDVNDDNQKIDAAIKAASDAVTGLSENIAAGSYCHIQTGTYIGTGSYGSSHNNSLTFGFTPKFVFVFIANQGWYAGGLNFCALWGSTATPTFNPSLGSPNHQNAVYSGNTMYWYNDSYPQYQCNDASTTYGYVAFG